MGFTGTAVKIEAPAPLPDREKGMTGSREQMHEQLLAFTPHEILLKKIYDLQIDPATMDYEQYLEIYPQLCVFVRDMMELQKVQTEIDDCLSRYGYQSVDEVPLEQSYQWMINEIRSSGPPVHMSQSAFRLNEAKNIDLVRHSRYSISYMHDHEFYEIAFVYQGECAHTFQLDGRQEQVNLSECDLVIIPPGLRHEVAVHGDNIMVNILINRDTFQQTFFSKIPGNTLLHDYFTQVLFSGKQQSFLVFHTEKDVKLKEMLLDMMLEREENDAFSNSICDSLLQIFFLQVLRHPQAWKENTGSGESGRSLTASLLLYIDNHYASVGLNKLAELYHYTPTYLSRVFRENTGTTILKYIQERRLEQACRLVTTTGMSVEQITETVGYQDISWFIGKFRQKYGKTPLQLRKASADKSQI